MQFSATKNSRSITIPVWALIVLFFAYALPGNIGHDPWRGDDVLHIDIASEMLRNGDWLVPRIGGIPHLDWPPLTHWIGAVLGAALGWLIPLHDAIRLTTVISLALAVWALRGTAKKLFGGESGNAAFLLSLGSLGLLIHAHEAQPQIALFAALSGTLYGLATIAHSPATGTNETLGERLNKGATIAGLSAAAAMLCSGLMGAALTLPLWLLLPLSCKECRRGALARAYLLGFAIAVLLAGLWPLALAIFQPNILQAWWQQELADIVPHSGHLARSSDLTQLLAWFAWPLWPVAGWAVWRRRKQLREHIYALPLAALVIAAWLVVTTGTFRPANVVPLLPPLILLAASELPRLRRGAANAFDWFGVMSFCAIGLFLWLAWFALHLGWPAPLARNVIRLLPGFVATWSWWSISIAILLSFAWIVSIVRMPYFPLRGATHLALGMTLAWALAIVLWQDWFDYDKNYRTIANQIAAQIHRYDQGCIATLGAGDAQRAALYYFKSLRVDPSSAAVKRCPTLITYSSGRNKPPTPDAGWIEIWNKDRGRGRQAEHFAVFRRSN